jgi:Na+/H+ antiporter NhaB
MGFALSEGRVRWAAYIFLKAATLAALVYLAAGEHVWMALTCAALFLSVKAQGET